MKQLKPTRVFEAVDVKDELPKEDGMYCVLSKCNVDFPLESYDSLKFIKGSFQQISNWEHIYWLKETTDKYLLSKEELEIEKMNFAINVLKETLKEHLKYSIDYNTTKSIIDMQIKELKTPTK